MRVLERKNSHLLAQAVINVDIGDICCAIKCQDPYLFGKFADMYSNFQSQKPADITIEVQAVNRMSLPEAKAALLQTRITRDGNRFVANKLMLETEFDTANRIVRVTVEKGLFDPSMEFKLMNRLLTVAYYTACKAKFEGSPPAMLVHSCGIARNGHALLFTGPCESGKTTVARLCGTEHGEVLNDEMVLVSQSRNEAMEVRGAPIIGGLAQRRNAGAPLKCVLVLKQSRVTELHKLSRLEACVRFMRQVVSPAHFGPVDRRTFWSLIADFSYEVTRITPFYELEFTLDKGKLWSVIGDLENALEKEE